jgi:hypothetical protein
MAQEFPMTRREDIKPFLFPCLNCNQHRFHALYEQPYGYSIKIAFVKKPLWSSNKGYQVVCETCTVVNGQLQAGDVAKLAMNILPRAIYAAYPDIHQFYTPGYYDAHRADLVGNSPEPELAALVDQLMHNYRLET